MAIEFDTSAGADKAVEVTNKFFNAGAEWLTSKGIIKDSERGVDLLCFYVTSCEHALNNQINLACTNN